MAVAPCARRRRASDWQLSYVPGAPVETSSGSAGRSGARSRTRCGPGSSGRQVPLRSWAGERLPSRASTSPPSTRFTPRHSEAGVGDAGRARRRPARGSRRAIRTGVGDASTPTRRRNVSINTRVFDQLDEEMWETRRATLTAQSWWTSRALANATRKPVSAIPITTARTLSWSRGPGPVEPTRRGACSAASVRLHAAPSPTDRGSGALATRPLPVRSVRPIPRDRLAAVSSTCDRGVSACPGRSATCPDVHA